MSVRTRSNDDLEVQDQSTCEGLSLGDLHKKTDTGPFQLPPSPAPDHEVCPQNLSRVGPRSPPRLQSCEEGRLRDAVLRSRPVPGMDQDTAGKGLWDVAIVRIQPQGSEQISRALNQMVGFISGAFQNTGAASPNHHAPVADIQNPGRGAAPRVLPQPVGVHNNHRSGSIRLVPSPSSCSSSSSGR